MKKKTNNYNHKQRKQKHTPYRNLTDNRIFSHDTRIEGQRMRPVSRARKKPSADQMAQLRTLTVFYVSPLFMLALNVFYVQERGRFFSSHPTPSSVRRLIWKIKSSFFLPGPIRCSSSSSHMDKKIGGVNNDIQKRIV